MSSERRGGNYPSCPALPISRRVLLLGLAAASYIAVQRLDNVFAAEYKPTVYGRLALKNADIYLPDTNYRFLSPPFNGDRFPILGYQTNSYRYIVPEPDGRFAHVPIEEVKITQGDPFDGQRRLPQFGIRNDHPDLMHFVLNIGAARVRIAPLNRFITPESKSLKTLKTASLQGLIPLFVYNPRILIEFGKVQEEIGIILKASKEIDLELGNEPDNQVIGFWEYQNLESFAEFIKLSCIAAYEINPKANLIVGALVNVAHTRELKLLVFTHTRHAAGWRGRSFFRKVSYKNFCSHYHHCHRGCVLQSRTGHFNRIYDSRLD